MEAFGRHKLFHFLAIICFLGPNLVLFTSALEPDDHIFYLQNDDNSLCVTISHDKIVSEFACETDFDSQKFLYKKSDQKIYSYVMPGFCLRVAPGTTEFEVEACVNSTAFTAPDLTASTLSLSGGQTFTTETDSLQDTHASAFTPFRNPHMADSNGAFSDIPFADCVLYDMAFSDINAELHPKGIAGFQDGERLYWQCKIGYKTILAQSEVYSTCGADGWDTDLSQDPIKCVRVQCPYPEVAQGSDIYVEQNNELKSLKLSLKASTMFIAGYEEETKDTIGHYSNLIFLFGDEILYQCDYGKIPIAGSQASTQSSICGADGKWTTAPLVCKNRCDMTNILTDTTAFDDKCGIFTTDSYPKYYGADDECYWIVDDQRDLETAANINYMFMDLQLDYNSIFQLTCQKDQVYTFNAKNEDGTKNTKHGMTGLCVSKEKEVIEKSTGMSVAMNSTLSANSSYLELQFYADAQLENTGILIEWWSDDLDISERPDHCIYNGTMAELTQEADHLFGLMYDTYHATYIGLLFVLMMIFGKNSMGKMNAKNKDNDDDFPGDLDEELSDEDSDSEDESDIYDQYDLDQDEDDVDDFSLLTLLEMKANRTELGTAVEKLTQEIDNLEAGDEHVDAGQGMNLNSNDNQGNRRMSNVNKIHGAN